MVSEPLFRTIKRACIIKIKRGEDGYTVVAMYTKLSEEQMERLISELLEEGYLK